MVFISLESLFKHSMNKKDAFLVQKQGHASFFLAFLKIQVYYQDCCKN